MLKRISSTENMNDACRKDNAVITSFQNLVKDVSGSLPVSLESKINELLNNEENGKIILKHLISEMKIWDAVTCNIKWLKGAGIILESIFKYLNVKLGEIPLEIVKLITSIAECGCVNQEKD